MRDLLHRVDLEARLLVRAEPLGQPERLCRRPVKKGVIFGELRSAMKAPGD